MRSEGVDSLPALVAQYRRLQLLVSELLLKNHKLRLELARLREAED